MKEKYYVNIQTHAISQSPTDSGALLTIYADQGDLTDLRSKLDTMHRASNDSYVRSHIPIMRYSRDPQNKEYDQYLEKAYVLMYQLGDEKTKEHIKELLPDLNINPKM